jgi:hypothetical protein
VATGVLIRLNVAHGLGAWQNFADDRVSAADEVDMLIRGQGLILEQQDVHPIFAAALPGVPDGERFEVYPSAAR